MPDPVSQRKLGIISELIYGDFGPKLPLSGRFPDSGGTTSAGIWLSLHRERDFEMATLERVLVSIAPFVSLKVSKALTTRTHEDEGAVLAKIKRRGALEKKSFCCSPSVVKMLRPELLRNQRHGGKKKQRRVFLSVPRLVGMTGPLSGCLCCVPQ
jgi:hypothetical protein